MLTLEIKGMNMNMSSDNTKATERQLAFIRSIEDALGYHFNFRYGTKEEASRYISAHIDEYNRYIDKYKEYLFASWDNIRAND